jgi:hypothetical protein
MILTAAIPAKNKITVSIFEADIFPPRYKKYPITRLTNAHTMFTVGDDNPFPGGLAKGVGKLSPDMPCIKWGTTFARKKPAKKQAR